MTHPDSAQQARKSASQASGANQPPGRPVRFDVVIVGAGISGIGCAHMLRERCPQLSFVILEAMESFGGTWLIHKYPGARSDSDLYTFGYDFKPWNGRPIASREEILEYLGSVIDDAQLSPHIRYRHRIRSAAWSSASHVWTLVNAGQEPPLFAGEVAVLMHGGFSCRTAFAGLALV